MIYTTKQNDLLDLIIHNHYQPKTDAQNAQLLTAVLTVNKGLCQYTGTLPQGLQINLPEIKTPKSTKPRVELWH